MGPRFNGPVYDPAQDFGRLTKQHERIRELMIDNAWRTVREISVLTGDPENSVQAQLRHLRKPRFGSFIVDKRIRKAPALWEYKVRRRGVFDSPYRGRSKAALLKRINELKEALQRYVEIDSCVCEEHGKCRYCCARRLLK